MIRNYIIIRKPVDLKKILMSRIYLEQETAQSVQDILRNSWGMRFSNKLAKKVEITDLSLFMSNLIQYRTEQLCKMNLGINATLYVWFDVSFAQICFNVLSGEDIELPFGCTVNIVDSLDIILQHYLDAAHEYSRGNYYKMSLIERENINWNDDDDGDPKKFILDVWVTTLRCDIQK